MIIKRGQANLNLDLSCHACGHYFTQRVGWRVAHVYCPVCSSREVHCYGPREKVPDRYDNGKVIPMGERPSQELLLAVK